jgi:predicted S18 family serine protease
MSKDFDDTMKQIIKNGKQMNNFDENIFEIKNYIKSLDAKIESIDEKLGLLIDIINNLSIFISEEEEEQESDEFSDSEWSPYNSYEEDDDESDNYL